MNTTIDEQELTRWLDSEMNPTDLVRFEAKLRNDPVMRSKAEAMQRLCSQVREHFPRVADVSHPDFFNSQIQERIRELDVADQREQEKVSPWLRWMHRPWLVLAGTMALVLLIGQVVFQGGDDADTATTLLNTYSPDANIRPRSYHSKDANATVLELDGVEDIPADANVVGDKEACRHAPHRWLAQAGVSSDRGTSMLALAMNDVSLPAMIAP